MYCGKKVVMDGNVSSQPTGGNNPPNVNQPNPNQPNPNQPGIQQPNIQGNVQQPVIHGTPTSGSSAVGGSSQKQGITPTTVMLICVASVLGTALIIILGVLVLFGTPDNYVKEAENVETTQTTTEYLTTTEEETTTETTTGESRYEIYKADVSWSGAQSDCISRGGHLVTFDTEEEYNKVLSLISGYGTKVTFYIGASRDANGSEYYWVNKNLEMYGDSLNGSSHWLSGEPSLYDSYSGASENVACLLYTSKVGNWVWNDIPDDFLTYAAYKKGNVAYICEFDG
jgi:hypothetical protein